MCGVPIRHDTRTIIHGVNLMKSGLHACRNACICMQKGGRHKKSGIFVAISRSLFACASQYIICTVMHFAKHTAVC